MRVPWHFIRSRMCWRCEQRQQNVGYRLYRKSACFMPTGGSTLLPTQSIGYRKKAERARWRRKIRTQPLHDQQHILILMCNVATARIAEVANLADLGYQ